jgi:hypothetical protein
MNDCRLLLFVVLIGLFSCVSSVLALGQAVRPEMPVVVRKPGCVFGGPVYCSPTDLDPAPFAHVPDAGDLVGAGNIITDPSFGNSITRITDGNTEGRGSNGNYAVDCGGSAEINFMNADDTMFYVCDGGSGMDLYTFDPTTMKASRMYVSDFPQTNGMRITTNSSSGEWSFTQKDVMYDIETGNYQAGTPIIKFYDFRSSKNPPRPQPLYNFSQNPNCVPSSAGITHWINDVTVSKDDQTFSTSFSLTGVAGSAVWVVVWNRTQGCRWLNTQNGQVGGEWGTTGTINLGDRFYIHNSRLSKDGNWVKIGFQSCVSACASGIQLYLWQIATNTLTACTIANNCLGHTALGFSHMVNSATTPKQQTQLIRPLSNIKQQTQVWTDGPPSHIPWDNHQSWENVNLADSFPYLSSSSTGVPIVYAWDNEIDGFSTDGSGLVYRFAHTFSSGVSPFFSSANAIGSVSADGKYFAWSSDWEGTLGSTTGSKTCTLTTNCRSDVFIVGLQ